MGDGAALCRVCAFSLNGDGVVAEDLEMSFGIGLLEELSAFSGRGDGIEHAGIGDARLRVVRDELISVCSNPYAWITRSSGHRSLSFEPRSVVNHFAWPYAPRFEGSRSRRNSATIETVGLSGHVASGRAQFRADILKQLSGKASCGLCTYRGGSTESRSQHRSV